MVVFRTGGSALRHFAGKISKVWKELQRHDGSVHKTTRAIRTQRQRQAEKEERIIITIALDSFHLEERRRGVVELAVS